MAATHVPPRAEVDRLQAEYEANRKGSSMEQGKHVHPNNNWENMWLPSFQD